MATHTRRETTIRRIDHVLPTPAAGVELAKAWNAAQADYRRTHTVDTGRALPDDALTITVGDDEVVISYEVTVDYPEAAVHAVLGQDGGQQ